MEPGNRFGQIAKVFQTNSPSRDLTKNLKDSILRGTNRVRLTVLDLAMGVQQDICIGGIFKALHIVIVVMVMLFSHFNVH